jgi:urease accessory protein
MKISKNLYTILAFIATFVPSVSYAHNGEPTTGLLSGLQHPITGLDHILAMTAVGLIAFMIGGKTKILLPLIFVSSMVVGSIIGATGLSLPFIEEGILISNLVLGAILLLLQKLPNMVNYLLIGAFALFHGFAHGSELPKDTNGITYGLGFILTTIGLHALGMSIGLIAQKFNIKTQKLMFRVAGMLVLLASTWILSK